jgi:transposase
VAIGIAEKRSILQLTLEPGTSVAEMARAHRVNANQVFKWCRALDWSELNEPCSALLPTAVTNVDEPVSEWFPEAHLVTVAGGSLQIGLLNRAVISIQSGADSALVRQILESLRQ